MKDEDGLTDELKGWRGADRLPPPVGSLVP